MDVWGHTRAVAFFFLRGTQPKVQFTGGVRKESGRAEGAEAYAASYLSQSTVCSSPPSRTGTVHRAPTAGGRAQDVNKNLEFYSKSKKAATSKRVLFIQESNNSHVDESWERLHT